MARRWRAMKVTYNKSMPLASNSQSNTSRQPDYRTGFSVMMLSSAQSGYVLLNQSDSSPPSEHSDAYDDHDRDVTDLCAELNRCLTRHVERTQWFRSYREIGFIRELEELCLTSSTKVVLAVFVVIDPPPSIFRPVHNAFVYDIPCLKQPGQIITSVVAADENGPTIVAFNPEFAKKEDVLRLLVGRSVDELKEACVAERQLESTEFSYPGQRFGNIERYQKSVAVCAGVHSRGRQTPDETPAATPVLSR